jgi:cytochrome P450
MVVTKPAFDEVPLSSADFWALTAAERERSYRLLRDHRPISWHRPAEGGLVPQDSVDPGYWAVVRHEDVVTVSKRADTFCSGRGVMLEDVPEEILEAAQSFLAMDSPRHTKLRKLVASAFTPRQVTRIEEQIRRHAHGIVDDLLVLGGCDFVEHVSKPLPMLTISEMMGVAPEERQEVTAAANSMVGWNDPDVVGDREPLEMMFTSLLTLTGAALRMAEARRSKPTEDLMTALVQAEVDGDRLTDEEIGAFFVLLSVAGNDTTRNTTSLAMKAFCDFPEQRELLIADFAGRIDGAIEEMVRWVTPVMTFRRTATRDVELRGRHISEGDKLVMFYASANWDERVFADPDRFDILRQPNPHVGFGGGGPHFCLGYFLARTQLRAIFDELMHRVPDLEVGEPQYLVGNFIHGVKTMPCRFAVRT